MLKPLPADPGRERLGFRDAVLASFGFLEEIGFTPKQEQTTFVRYERGDTFVNVYHGRSSYEIGVEVGRVSRNVKYPLGYIVEFFGGWEVEGFGRHTMFQVSSREGVQKFVPKVAELVRRYGLPFVDGDDAFYDRVEGWERAESQRLRVEGRVKRAREEGEQAWGRKEFHAVVEAYESIAGDLTLLEKKRLDYARKRLPSKHSRPN